ncbi:MAG: hypothetical protein AB8H79_21525 [Myxococcota bacterium]
MSESPFDPPAANIPAKSGRDTPVSLNAAGMPQPVDLLKATFNEFMEDVGPYALAGLGITVVGFGLAMIWMGIGFGCLATIMVGTVATMGAAATNGGDVGQAIAALGPLGFMLAYVGTLLTIVVGISASAAPFNGSLFRAVDNFRNGGAELGFGSAFNTAFKQPIKDIITVLVIQLLVIVGLFFFYVGALFVGFFLGWTALFTMLEGDSVVTAIKKAFAHTREHMGWHLAIFGLNIVVGLLAGYVPVLGPMFHVLFYVRVYRSVFPAAADDEEAGASDDAGTTSPAPPPLPA